MKGYKAFGKGMICRGKQYAENTVFEESEAKICERGMHFCENPLDVLDYYSLVDGNGDIPEFAEVEALDDPKTDDKKKYCTKRLKIGAKLSLGGFINAGVEFIYEKTKEEVQKDNVKEGYGSRLAASGYGSQLAASGYGSRLDSTGKNAVIMAAGHGSLAKGKIGSWITLAECGTVNGEYMPLSVVTKKIDGEEIKEDTFYTLKNGEFVEVQE